MKACDGEAMEMETKRPIDLDIAMSMQVLAPSMAR
jgi:hypothetical protein